MKPPPHQPALGDAREVRRDVGLLNVEFFQGPLDAHEEHVVLVVNVLLEIQDVAPVLEDKMRDGVDKPWLVGAIDEEDGGVCGHRAGSPGGALRSGSCLTRI